MKRFSVLVWAGMVSACAASTIVGCGDEDTTPPAEETPESDGGPTSKTIPARDAAGTDSQTKADTGVRDGATESGATDTGAEDARPDDASLEAGTDAGADADAGARPDADAAAQPDADAAAQPDADAAPPIDAGDPSICHAGTAGTVSSVFPSGSAVSGAKVGYSECPGAVTVAANSAYSPNVKTGVEGRLTVSGLTFHTTTTGWIKSAAFGPPFTFAPSLLGVGPDITPYDSLKAHVLVSLNGSGGCLKSGNTVTVDGHPEGVVKYVDLTGAEVAGGKTGADGLVWISGLTPSGADATMTVTPGVAGCKRDDGQLTGKFPVLANIVTALTVQLAP